MIDLYNNTVRIVLLTTLFISILIATQIRYVGFLDCRNISEDFKASYDNSEIENTRHEFLYDYAASTGRCYLEQAFVNNPNGGRFHLYTYRIIDLSGVSEITPSIRRGDETEVIRLQLDYPFTDWTDLAQTCREYDQVRERIFGVTLEICGFVPEDIFDARIEIVSG